MRRNSSRLSAADRDLSAAQSGAEQADRAEREATAQRDAQKILAEGLTPEILRLRAIEAFQKLAESPNAKVIVTDGKAPLVTGN